MGVLQVPLENRTKLVNPGEILLHRLNCIRAIVCSLNIFHLRILKDVIIQVVQTCSTFIDDTKCKVRTQFACRSNTRLVLFFLLFVRSSISDNSTAVRNYNHDE